MRRLAELREKALKDHNSFYNSARREGLADGRAEGLIQGRKEGIGQNKIDTAKAMLNEKLDINLISKITGLSVKEIKNYNLINLKHI